MRLKSCVMDKIYAASMKMMEATCLSGWRNILLSEISGDVLIKGSITGINLVYYPNSIEKLVLTEPGHHMRTILEADISHKPNRKYTATEYQADALDYPDNSFDAVVRLIMRLKQ